MKMELNRIYQGNALEVLKTLPDESIDCCISSPPYWGLRDYGIEGQIWDGDKNCKHIFGEEKITKAEGMAGGGVGKIHMGDSFNPREKNMILKYNVSQGQFCCKCGAWKGSLGLEPDFKLYIKHLCDIYDEVKRVLKKEGTCWVNLGDTYGGSGGCHKEHHKNDSGFQGKRDPEKGGIGNDCQQKSLCQIPSRFAIEMSDRGWILRNEIIWHKPNCMPSSAEDRFTVDFEKIFFFVKSKKYWFERQFEKQNDKEILYRTKIRKGKKYKAKEPYQENTLYANWATKKDTVGYNPNGRNKRCVWKITTQLYAEAHFATFPEKLVETPIKAGCPEKGVVMDPFMGSGTVALVARKLGRNYVGIEMNPEYIKMAEKRLSQEYFDF